MTKLQVHYLVGGFRISLGAESATPGPRTHIVNFVRGLDENGCTTRIFLASGFPFMKRFAQIKQTDYAKASESKVWLADAVRLAAAVWCGLNVFCRSLVAPRPEIIYERLAVLQSLTSFHFGKRQAVRIVEANGVLSRETARDRNVLKAERLAAYLERRVLRRADIVVAVSQNLADELVKFASIEPDKIIVIPNGVRADLAEYPRKPDSVRVIGFVGSVVKWHRLDEIIESIAAVANRRGTDLRFEIVGDGADLPNLRAMVEREGLSDLVRFRGRVPPSDAFDIMTGWDIGIASHQKSSSDTMYHSPLKLYEYTALGMSVLCTDSQDARAIARSGADVRIFSGKEDFERLLDTVLSEERRSNSEIEESRQSVVRDHSWRTRAAQVLAAAAR
ncbi:2-deoxystreptamine glucosyltransferase [Rhodococcus sp. Br-6]|nr:2-deoxystreptamine glucosyltransferase [Rhodococcus sp. Br-6]